MNARWIKAISVSVILAATAYLITALWVGRTDVVAALDVVKTQTLMILLSLSLTNYALRFLRWHYYLHKLGSSIDVRHDLKIYIGGFALTTTPGKAGELARSLWLQPYGVPANLSVAAFLAERIQDLIAVMLISCLGVSLYPRAAWVLFAGLAFILTALIALLVPAVTQFANRFTAGRRGRVAMVVHRVVQVLVHTRGCLTPAPLAVGLLLGIIAWSAESLSFAILMQALGHPIPLFSALSIYAFSMLAGAISFMPGGLGGSEATMIILLRLCGVPLSIAVSATLLIRAATLWFAVLLGIIALSIRVKAPVRDPAETNPAILADGAK